ncbi:MAG: hypothetical protein F6K19_50560 [Cyanothece sp. SIO1E1]|nr:hypothetical protein [Cyanothece sp. SIO1E1]
MNKFSFLPSMLTTAGIVIAATTMPAQAFTFNFKNITNNSSTNAAIGESQLFLEVTDAGNGQALFTFLNQGPDAASITQIYFDDEDNSILSDIALVDDSAGGVSFEEARRPGNLPGGNPIDFDADFEVSPTSRGGVANNGISPTESLGITFDLAGTFDNLINELSNGELMVGFHVQAFQDGGSESFVSVRPPENPPTGNSQDIPEPGTAVAMGLFALGTFSLKKK